MEYSVSKLCRIAGVSARTLRYYDRIGLLKPCRISSGGYRIYGAGEVDLLQQILLYREMGVALGDIKSIIYSPGFDKGAALQSHLLALTERRAQLDRLIANVEKTISTLKGEETMNDREKFEGFKQRLLDENEKNYGAEIREKYGDEAVEASNRKFSGMTPEQYAQFEALTQRLNETLKRAFEQGDPAGELAQEACALHKQWLCFTWVSYSKEAHMGVAQMYVDDPRFTAYYDDIAVGCAPFLRDAVRIYCK